MLRVFLLAALLGAASSAEAADKLNFAPAADWVRPIGYRERAADPVTSGALQVLLADSQTRFTRDGANQVFWRSVMRALTPEALGSIGTVSIEWYPETDAITVNRLAIVRDGKTIDVLKAGREFLVLRREEGLEASMLDGALTATLQIEDLRVGDVLDFAFTRERRDPVLKGHAESFYSLLNGVTFDRQFTRRVWPRETPVRWRKGAEAGEFKLDSQGTETELVRDSSPAEPRQAPAGAPTRFLHIADLELTDFRDWAEVSALMAPHYATASTLVADSPLRAEVARIAAQHTDARARAAAALRLVQDQIRYVFLGMDSGNYIPAGADETWRRRFADCKGKTALLLALLRVGRTSMRPRRRTRR